ncbi:MULTISPECIES: HIRAN domain-containing protein [Hungatella]|jgi:hypothetical protein|nr:MULTISPECIES: HIRAN domain-containing protein [Hungatella]
MMQMKQEYYITITGTSHYYGMRPFSVGKRFKCVKEPSNPYDGEAIRAVMKEIGTIGYVANSAYTTATGTMSAGRIYDRVQKKFQAEVMFITSSKVICRVVKGIGEEKEGETVGKAEDQMGSEL